MGKEGVGVHSAFQTKPMIFYYRLRTAVIAIDPGLRILEFRRHGLVLDCSF